MKERTTGSRFINTLLAAVVAAAVFSLSFVQFAFADRVEGPLRADPSAYEHISDDGDPSEMRMDDSIVAQAVGGSTIVEISLTLEQMAELEVKVDTHGYYTYSQYLELLDPASYSGESQLTIFADLTSPSGLTAAQIDAYIDSVDKGRTGMLHGLGYAFIKAENTYHVSAAYLVAHAILETGWGTSDLAKGYDYDGTTELGSDKKTYPAGTYYNFFGIGAYDDSPLSGGRSKAIQEGWNSQEAAVMGGAEWISRYYINASEHKQQTLYAMKWDYCRAMAENSPWHQYATGKDWPVDIARLMNSAYSNAGVEHTFNYIIPEYRGSKSPDTNSRTMYRLYNPNTGEHLYTSDLNERVTLVSLGWRYEGVGWYAPKESSTPVYRLYNPYSGDHHYTTDRNEKDVLDSIGWNYENVGWYSDDAKTVPLYREYNPYEERFNHNFTASENEHKTLVGKGWRDEGIAWYGLG